MNDQLFPCRQMNLANDELLRYKFLRGFDTAMQSLDERFQVNNYYFLPPLPIYVTFPVSSSLSQAGSSSAGNMRETN